MEHSAILLTCIKRKSVLKAKFCVLFVWPLKVGFTVFQFPIGKRITLLRFVLVMLKVRNWFWLCPKLEIGSTCVKLEIGSGCVKNWRLVLFVSKLEIGSAWLCQNLEIGSICVKLEIGSGFVKHWRLVLVMLKVRDWFWLCQKLEIGSSCVKLEIGSQVVSKIGEWFWLCQKLEFDSGCVKN